MRFGRCAATVVHRKVASQTFTHRSPMAEQPTLPHFASSAESYVLTRPEEDELLATPEQAESGPTPEQLDRTGEWLEREVASLEKTDQPQAAELSYRREVLPIAERNRALQPSPELMGEATYTLTESGTLYAEVDEETAEKYFPDFYAELRKGLRQYLKKEAKPQRVQYVFELVEDENGESQVYNLHLSVEDEPPEEEEAGVLGDRLRVVRNADGSISFESTKNRYLDTELADAKRTPLQERLEELRQQAAVEGEASLYSWYVNQSGELQIFHTHLRLETDTEGTEYLVAEYPPVSIEDLIAQYPGLLTGESEGPLVFDGSEGGGSEISLAELLARQAGPRPEEATVAALEEAEAAQVATLPERSAPTSQPQENILDPQPLSSPEQAEPAAEKPSPFSWSFDPFAGERARLSEEPGYRTQVSVRFAEILSRQADEDAPSIRSQPSERRVLLPAVDSLRPSPVRSANADLFPAPQGCRCRGEDATGKPSPPQPPLKDRRREYRSPPNRNATTAAIPRLAARDTAQFWPTPRKPPPTRSGTGAPLSRTAPLHTPRNTAH